MMDAPLGNADSSRLGAAERWIERGNPLAAKQELDGIADEFQRRPEVLRLRWRLCAQQHQWEQCLGLASLLCQVAPNDRLGWLHHAESLAQLGRPREASRCLLEAMHRLKPDSTLPLYLARYCSADGDIESAQRWLRVAFEIAKPGPEREQLERQILDDPRLMRIWTEQG